MFWVTNPTTGQSFAIDPSQYAQYANDPTYDVTASKPQDLSSIAASMGMGRPPVPGADARFLPANTMGNASNPFMTKANGDPVGMRDRPAAPTTLSDVDYLNSITDLQGATKRQADAANQAYASSPQGAAQTAAADTRSKLAELYDQVNARQSQVTPDVVAGLQRNAINQPTYGANAADRGLVNAYFGGGHMGGYGNAAADVNGQMAQAQRDTSMANLNLQIAQHGDQFANDKSHLLSAIKSADPTFANFNQLSQEDRAQGNTDRAFAASQQQQGIDNTYRSEQGNNAMLGAGAQGWGTFAASPVGQAAIGGLTGALAGPGGAITGAVGGFINGMAHPQPVQPAAQYNPNQVASGGTRHLSSVGGSNPYGQSSMGTPGPLGNSIASAPRRRTGGNGAFDRGWS